jgi:hypothetical protein
MAPVITIVQTILNGPSHTFHVPAGCGWSGLAIERLLRDHGVRIWGKMIFNRTIMFTVRLPQAMWAQCLLERAGIPIDNPMLRSPAQRRGKTRSRARTRSAVGTLEASLDRLDDVLERLH